MDLSTVARIKARIEGINNTDHDTVLAEILTSVSQRVENYMNRNAETTARTSDFNLGSTQLVVSLPAYPVSASPAAVVTVDTGRAFTGDAVDVSNYYIDAESGALHFDAFQSYGRGILRVAYTGGMAANAAAFVTSYPDIAQAVDEQVAFTWQRRRKLGLLSTGTGTGSEAIASQDLLESVSATLDHHRRVNV